jgi:hypothetical protein
MDISRVLLFLIGCIGTRAVITYVAYKASPDILQYLGYLALLPAIGFFTIYFMDLRKTGAEVFGERIWWNNLRPIHGMLYTLFAVSAITQQPHAWAWLLADVLLGLVSYIARHAFGVAF